MGRKYSPPAKNELAELITNYEAAKAEEKPLYLDAYQLADIADWYATERRFHDAQVAIDYGLKLHPGNTGLLVEQAYLYLDTQNIQKAKRVAKQISDNFDADVKMLKAELLLNEGQLEKARALLDTLPDAGELEAIADVIYLYIDMGYPEEAKEWLERGRKRYAEEEEFTALNADYLASMRELEQAIVLYNKLIDNAPFNPSYWMGLAKCYFTGEQMDKAIEACDFALAADDRYGEAYTYKGHCFFYLSNADLAIENYEKAIQLKAFPPELGYMFIGISYANKEEWQQASDCYDKVIKHFEEEDDMQSVMLIDPYTSKATALSNLGQYSEAHRLCELSKEINPNEALIYLAEGKIYLEEVLLEEAAYAFGRTIELNRGIETWYLIGSAYSDCGYAEEAKPYLEQVFMADPEYDKVAEKLRVISLILNDADEFFKYNNACSEPLDAHAILDLLQSSENTEENQETLKEVWKRLAGGQ